MLSVNSSNFCLSICSHTQAAEQMMKLYALLIEKDATVVEINPIVEINDNGTKRGDDLTNS